MGVFFSAAAALEMVAVMRFVMSMAGINTTLSRW